MGRVPTLSEDPSRETGSLLQSLVRDPVGPWRAPMGFEDKTDKIALEWAGLMRERGPGSASEVKVEHAVGLGREGRARCPEGAAGVPEHPKEGLRTGLPLPVTPPEACDA